MRLTLIISVFGGLITLGFANVVPPRAIAADESRQVAEGRSHYMESCKLCHGEDGKRGEGFQTPIWGSGALIGAKFGNAQALIDYMQLMPFNDPTLLNDAQKLAVVAYLLVQHGAIKPTDTIDPNRASEVAIK